MQMPSVSCGARKMQPSTPCSASGECGGKRSTVEMARASDGDFLRRPFRKSAETAPASGFTESSIAEEDTRTSPAVHDKLVGGCWKVFHRTRVHERIQAPPRFRR